MRHKVFDKLYRFFSSPELTVAVMLYGVALSLAAVCFGAGNGGGFFECFFFTLDFGGLKIPLAGGSTLGHISAAHVSINTVDIGLAQLAMHSAYETAGAKDTEYLAAAAREFFGSSFTQRGEITEI